MPHVLWVGIVVVAVAFVVVGGVVLVIIGMINGGTKRDDSQYTQKGIDLQK